MSIIAPALKRTWWPYAAVAVALGLAATLIVADLVRRQGTATTSDTARPGSIAAPGIEQARWEIDTFASGSNGRPTKTEIRAIAAQRPQVTRTITSIYDAALLRPGRLDRVVGRHFAPAAAKSFLATKAGVPANSHNVQIMKRSARVGIDALGASHAAAKVDLVATGETDAGEWRISHQATLWLEKAGSSWRVIGFEIAQKPVR